MPPKTQEELAQEVQELRRQLDEAARNNAATQRRQFAEQELALGGMLEGAKRHVSGMVENARTDLSDAVQKGLQPVTLALQQVLDVNKNQNEALKRQDAVLEKLMAQQEESARERERRQVKEALLAEQAAKDAAVKKELEEKQREADKKESERQSQKLVELKERRNYTIALIGAVSGIIITFGTLYAQCNGRVLAPTHTTTKGAE